MKVLIADTFEQSGMDGLKNIGCEVVYRPDSSGETLVDAVRESAPDVLVVRSTPVDARALETGSLSLVVRAGAGYNTIDVKTASSRGIYVSNCPEKNAVAVAELAFGLMLALDRRIPDNVTDLRNGRWNKREYSNALGLFGRTVGLLGYGNIAKEVAARAGAFGMRVAAWSRSLKAGRAPELAGGVPISIAASPQALAEQSDVLSVHLALTSETRGFVNASVLDKLRPGSYFINTARADVVDYHAVERVVRDRNVRVALDVFPGEPETATGAFSHSLMRLPNVYGTHHIGASTDQAQHAIAAETVRIIATYLRSGQVPNAVNLATITPATCKLVVRHRDRPGVLAHVFDHLRSSDINVQETENIVFDGAEAAVARINLDNRPSAATLQAIRNGNRDIFDVMVVAV